MRTWRATAIAALLLVAVSSCSNKPVAQRSNPGKQPSATQTTTFADPLAAKSSPKPKPVILPTGALTLPSCLGFKLTPREVLKPGDPYLIALVSVTGPYGDCNRLLPGKTCRLQFGGSWDVMGPKGYLVYQVFENGSTKPLQNLRFGPVPPRGSIEPGAFSVTYTPSRNARVATFRWLLLDPTGKVIARSQSETLPIPTCTDASQ